MIQAFTGEHGAFIAGSWVAAVAILGGIAYWIAAEGRKLRRKISALEHMVSGTPSGSKAEDGDT